MENQNFNDVDFGGAMDFDPDNLEAEETINAVFVVDISPSIRRFEGELNAALKDFTETMQKSHVADNLLVSIVEFNDSINVKSGFQPITNIKLDDFQGTGYGTALYDAVLKGMKQALDYKETLEQSGITCKTLLFVITDGEDNSSDFQSAEKVKQLHLDILQNEQNAFSFVSVMFGLGDEANFKEAKDNMGIQHLGKVGTTGAELRKMINFISSSISSASSGGSIPDITF